MRHAARRADAAGERGSRSTAVALVTCEDVTELRAAQLGERLVADDLRSILEGIADAVTAQGPDGSLVYANDAAVRVLGFPSAEALLRAPLTEIMARWEMLTPEGEPLSPMSLPGRQALMGEEPEPMLVQFREPGGHETRWSRIKAKPVREADGTVRLAINVIEDVTELKQVEEAQRFLAESSRLLAGSLDYESTLATIAKLAVPGVADWCGVDLAGDRPLEAQRVAVEHVDPAKVALAQELADRYPAEARTDRGLHQVLTTGESQLWPHIPDELIVEAAQDEEHLRLIRELGMSSAMIVPMRVRERVLGAISFVSAESGKTFTPADLRLAEDLALRAGRRSRTRASTARARRSPRRCRPRCCRRCCLTSRAPTPARSTRRPAKTTRSAATSTTCSRPARTTGSRSSATSAARAPRRRRSPRWCATRSARRRRGATRPRRSCAGSTR